MNAKRKVLVVESEPVLARFESSLLLRSGYEAICASDVNGALSALVELNPDMVVVDTDITSDPMGFARHIRQNMSYTGKILLVTDRILDLFHGNTQGYFDGCIQKPFEPKDFMDRSRRLLGDYPLITLCVNCMRNYEKDSASHVAHKSDRMLGNYTVRFFKTPDHSKDADVSHGICPQHYLENMERINSAQE